MTHSQLVGHDTTPVNRSTSECVAYAQSCDEYRALYDRTRSNTFVLNGHRCSIKVVNNALHIQPGSTSGEVRDPVIYYRGMVPVKKIIILSDSGYVSLDAFYWCRDQSISLLLLDGHGEQVYSIVPESKSDAGLRRRQYLACDTEKGARIALELLHRKTMSQYDTMLRHPELRKRDKLLQLLEQAEWELSHPDARLLNLDYLRLYEGRLALAYFDAFVGLPLKWGIADAKKIPPHWKKITPRISPLSNGNGRHAVCPFHAALNYLYTVTEHQILVAIHEVGLDPACGFLHADKVNRQSLVYDLVEPYRALVDDHVLSFFCETVLKRGDVVALDSGALLFNAEFARYLLASCKIADENLREPAGWLVDLL